MKYLSVDLYSSFECIADKCPNTCCAGWSITIDKETYQKMVAKEDILGVPAKDWLTENDDDFTAKLHDYRCYMLNEDNLCKVVLSLGPSYLSDLCTSYPRIENYYGNFIEEHLNMSCPHVIAQLMDKEQVNFRISEDSSVAPSYAYDQLYMYESAARADMVNLLYFSAQVSLNTRLYVCFDILNTAISFYQNGETDFLAFRKETNVYFQEKILSTLDNNLHHIVNENHRYMFLKQLQTLLTDYDHINPHSRFAELAHISEQYFNNNDIDNYASDLSAFRSEMLSYDMFITNYWVYRIFSDIISIPDFTKSLENFIYIAVEYCLFQMISLAYYTTNSSIDKDTYIYIISSVSRILEHDKPFGERITNQLKANNLISAAGLLLLCI